MVRGLDVIREQGIESSQRSSLNYCCSFDPKISTQAIGGLQRLTDEATALVVPPLMN
jgi:hypothetical protein